MARYTFYFSFVFLSSLINSTIALSEAVNAANWQLSTLSTRLKSMPGGQGTVDLFKDYISRRSKGTFTPWDMAQIAAICGAIPGIWYLQRQLRRKDNDNASSRSTSRLKTGVVVNEDDSGGKHIQSLYRMNHADEEKMETQDS
jgi:hypothetical protein